MRRALVPALFLAVAALVTPNDEARADLPPGLVAMAPPPWLGVTMDAGTDMGVSVQHVVRGSPAHKGGVHTGDRIVSVDGVQVTAPGEVTRAVQGHKIGDAVSVGLERRGSAIAAQVTLAARPSGDEILRMDLVGAAAPEWTNVTALSGAPSTVASLKGRVVVVDFWASWCGPCRLLEPKLSALKDRYGAQGLSVVGITTDDAEKTAVFAEQHKMKYPSVVDRDGDTSKSYGITGLPTVLVLDKKGVVRDVFVGYDPAEDAKVDDLVKKLLAEPVR